MRAHVEVILPGLFDLPLLELDDDFCASRLPALNHILRFGQRLSNPLDDFEGIFSDSLGVVGQTALPFAGGFAGIGESSSRILLAQATHIKADVRNAFVLPLDQNEETKENILFIINDLCDLFKEDCDITLLEDGLYLINLKHCEAPGHYPHILSVTGRKVDPYIEQSRQALPWYQLINEMQMFMHAHEVNQGRLAKGLLPINSLWCWGAGEFVEPPDRQIKCYCDDSILSAYISRAELKLQALDDFPGAGFSKQNIYIDLGLLRALKSSDGEDLQSLLSGMESKLFKPLVKAVDAGQISLRLRTGHDYDFQLSRFSALKSWRKSVNLKMFLT